MSPQDLISIARHLAGGGVVGSRGRPRQTDLCRAISAAYYAMFHTLARCGADLIAGATYPGRNQSAWEQTYRALEHGQARSQCRNRSVMAQFTLEIQRFGRHFVDMQRHRHYADYAPNTDYHRLAVVSLIDETARVIAEFNNVPAGERRAFAIHVLFRTRRD